MVRKWMHDLAISKIIGKRWLTDFEVCGDFDHNNADDRARYVKMANEFCASKGIVGLKFFDVRDAEDELEWLVEKS